jgi:UPF0176 protein
VSIFHLAFYQFVQVADPSALAQQLRRLTADVLGSIVVAQEGINGVLAGDFQALQPIEQWFAADARFARMPFKRSPCNQQPFGRLKVHVKPQIVSVGIDGAQPSPQCQQVSPRAWRELIAQDHVVVLDNRNGFEFRLGHFHGAIDPQVNHFRDFPKFVREHAAQWRAQKKQVAMYCTGGIRCEKMGGWMADDLGLDVVQLDGGILNFFQTMADADRDWQGQCFVFDKRLGLNTQLQATNLTLEDVYSPQIDGTWRYERAQRLATNT